MKRELVESFTVAIGADVPIPFLYFAGGGAVHVEVNRTDDPAMVRLNVLCVSPEELSPIVGEHNATE